MTAQPTHILTSAPPEPGTERFDTLCQFGPVTIERIVSSGTQPPQCFCQKHDEWVLLVQGQAELVIEQTPLSLRAGDSLTIRAGVPHEVRSTSENAVWIAVHAGPQLAKP